MRFLDKVHAISASTEFRIIIDQFGLVQHVTEPTYKSGGWLDLVLTRDDCSPSDVRVYPPTVSDHGLVTATIPFLCDTPSYIIRQVRDWRSFDRSAFASALLEIRAVADPSIVNDLPIADVFATYQTAMAEVFERLLPTRQARIRRCGLRPWFNAECRSLRRDARRLERLYRRTRAPADRVSWVKYVRAMHRTYRDREREHWEARIAAHSEQPKRLWATFNPLLGRGRADRSSNPPSFTVEDYLASFPAKVQTIRDDTAGSPPPTFPSTTCILSAVTAITPAELRRIIIAAAPKSFALNPFPTFLLQEHLDILIPLLTTICNRSIVEGVMPLDQKRSILVPVIKRPGLDPTDPGNFRPIANVCFISKVIEKIIAYQLVLYLEANNLIPAIQSGFRKGHSTETLLLSLLSDIYIRSYRPLATH